MTLSRKSAEDAGRTRGSLDIRVHTEAPHTEAETAVVVLAGELDLATAPDVRVAIERLLLTGRRRIVVDLDAVTFLDAAALDVMITATLAVATSGGTLSVTPHAPMMQLLSFTCETHRVNVATAVRRPAGSHPLPHQAPATRIPLARPRGTDAPGATPGDHADAHLPWLLAQAADGDERAFLAVYDATAARAYGIGLQLLGDPDEAAKLVEEAYLELWLHAAAFRSSGLTASAWVLTTVHRCAASRARSRTSGTTTVDPGVRTNTRSRSALAADLSPTQRDAVELTYFAGRLHTEVEQLRGLPPGTARSRIRDGLLALRHGTGGSTRG